MLESKDQVENVRAAHHTWGDAYSIVAALGYYLCLEAFWMEVIFPLYGLLFLNSGRKCVRVLGEDGLCSEEGGEKRWALKYSTSM